MYIILKNECNISVAFEMNRNRMRWQPTTELPLKIHLSTFSIVPSGAIMLATR